MKHFNKKTTFSIASAALLSLGMLISTQASANFQRCDRAVYAGKPVWIQPSPLHNLPGFWSTPHVFDSYKNTCQTPRIYLTAGKPAYFFGAVCANNKKSTPIDATIHVVAAPKDGDLAEGSWITSKSTKDQKLNQGLLQRTMSHEFKVPVSGYYSAHLISYPSVNNNGIIDGAIVKYLEARAIITHNPNTIPNQEYSKSLCD